MNERPPRLAEWLLVRLLPPEQTEFVVGDLGEAFHHDVAHDRTGARLRYWKEALAAVFQLRTVLPSKPVARRRNGDSLMSTFVRDVWSAARTLRRAPGYAAATVVIMAVGIGATTSIYSVANPILFRPLPYVEPDELVVVWEKSQDGSNSRTGYATFRDLATSSSTLASSAAMGSWLTTISSGEGDPERLTGQRVSWQFFEMLGVRPVLGRSFLPEEDAPNLPRGVILTHGLWQRRFGGDSALVGRTVVMDGSPAEVLGVLPADFDDVFEPRAQIYRVLGYDVSQPWACRTCRHLRMAARVRNNATRAEASTELNGLSERIVAQHPTQYPAAGVNLVRVQDEVTRSAKPALLSVLIAAAFLLLSASANVTNLTLARSSRRLSEFAVRTALGAGRTRLARQLIAEGLLLAVIGGGAGVLLAAGAVSALVAALPADLPRLSAVKLDVAALGLATLITLGVGILVGLAPLAHTRRSAFAGLRSGTRLAGPRRRTGRTSIVVAEVALALMLLVGTGLLGRSMMSLLSVNPGFEPERLLTLEIQSTGPRYAENETVWGHHDRVREAVAALPGVVAAEVTTQLPLGGNFDGNGVHAQDRPLDNPELAPAGQRYAVSPGYLEAMRIPLLRGRDFTAADNREDAARVVIVSASLARRIWGNDDAIGKRVSIGLGDRPWLEVIGIAGDVRHTGLDETELMGFYVPERQWDWADPLMVLVVRTAVEPASIAPAVLHSVRSVDPTQPITNVRRGEEVLAASTAQRRLSLWLFAAFAVTATLLSAAGVYGVLAGDVAERRREIGIRAVLGATPQSILGLIVRQGVAPAVLGLGIGLAGALALSRYLRALLYGIEPNDPITLAATAALLGGVAVAASLVPAWNATRVDPMTTLRSE